MPGPIKGLFFDLDGTLVDTNDANFSAYHQAIKEIVGVDVSLNKFSRTRGMSSKDFLPILIPNITSEQINEINARKSKIYQNCMHLTKPNKILIDFLSELSSHHLTVLVTTAKKINANKVLNEYDLAKCFDHIIYGDDVKKNETRPRSIHQSS